MLFGLLLAAALAAAAVPSAARGTPNAVGMAAGDPSQPSGATPHHMAPRAGSSAALPDTALMRLRAARNGEPVWLDVDGRPGPNAADAVALLGNASAEGLDPDGYGADALGKRMRALASGAAEEADATAWDLELSRSVLRYLRHLHVGRVDPRRLGFRVGARTSDPDFAALLLDALDRRRLRALAEELAPPLSQYRLLRKRLAEYRALAEQGFEPLTVPAAPVRPDEPYVDAAALERRLVALGDMTARWASHQGGALSYDAVLARAVQRFQHRHGLVADGVLGKATLAALNVPPARRVRQIELALERMRWLPPLSGQRWAAVNIPMFRLWAWGDDSGAATAPKTMGVIVGRALVTQTPVFVDDMTHLIFRPYWNVPASIVRNEILPALARNPSYLQRHDMEIVAGAGDDAVPVAASAANLALLRQGSLRLRQRPGLDNALGLVKFVFPNDANVYMHSTPAPELFGRSRRDFSHGCVRLEDATSLAEWALRGQPQWTRSQIEAAMRGTTPRRADLARPIRVMLFYVTAMVWPDDGAMHFADDIYGHDVRLERALAARSAD